MKALFGKVQLLTAIGLVTVSQFAAAGNGGSGSVSYAPAKALVVPVMSNGLMVLLGLLLAVIAYRTLKNRQAYQRVLSVALLSGGLVVAGFGVERSIATSSVTAQASGCATGDTLTYDAEISNRAEGFQNNCLNAVEITDNDVNCGPGYQRVREGAEGQTVPGEGGWIELDWCRDVRNGGGPT